MMNRIVKAVAAVGVIACVAGGVLIGVGYLTGGMDYVEQRDCNSISDRGLWSDNQMTQEKTKLDDVKEMHAELTHLDLCIQPSDDDSWYLEYTVQKTKTGEDPISCEVKDGVLNLEESDGADASYDIHIDLSGFGVGEKETSNENVLILYAPKDTMLRESEITLADGDLSMEGVSCQTANWKLQYGDLLLRNGTILGGSIQLDDGDASLKQAASENTDWIMKYGDLLAEQSQFTGGSVQLYDGDLEGKTVTWSTLPLTLSYGELEERGSTWDRIALTMQDGDVDSSQLTVQGENTVVSKYGDVTVSMTPESRKQTVLDLRADYGEVNAYRSVVEGENNSLTVTCEDGDIDIE